MTLDQLMAFTVNADHERQEQVWEASQRSHNKEAYYIRRLLTEGAIRASDKRAQFVGIEAYEAAGGDVMRDLFSRTTAAGCRTPCCSIGLLPKSWSARRMASAPKGGNGWTSRSTFLTATPRAAPYRR